MALTLPSDTITSGKKVEALFKQFKGRCRYCDGLVKLYVTRDETRFMATREHLVPKARGGPNGAGNIGLSCQACNAAKGDMTDIEFKHLIKTKKLHPNYIRWLEKSALDKIRHRIS